MKSVTTTVLLIARWVRLCSQSPLGSNDKATHLRTPTSGSVWLGLRLGHVTWSRAPREVA